LDFLDLLTNHIIARSFLKQGGILKQRAWHITNAIASKRRKLTQLSDINF